MSWVAQTFDEFGRTIGLPGLSPGARGQVSLRIGDDCRLDFRVLDDAVLLMMVRPFTAADRLLVMRHALDLCHLRHGWTLPVRAGLSRDGQLVLIARLPMHEFRPPAVDQAFDLLRRLHDRIGS